MKALWLNRNLSRRLLPPHLYVKRNTKANPFSPPEILVNTELTLLQSH